VTYCRSATPSQLTTCFITLERAHLSCPHRPSSAPLSEHFQSRSAAEPALALRPYGVYALLQVAGFVEHQHRIGVAEPTGDVVAQDIARSVGVPAGPGEQMLHAVRVGVSGVFGDGPAVLPRQVGQQPENELVCAMAVWVPKTVIRRLTCCFATCWRPA
jgi:hypothetical protein